MTIKIKELEKVLTGSSEYANVIKEGLISNDFNLFINIHFYKVLLSEFVPNADIINFKDEMLFVERVEVWN